MPTSAAPQETAPQGTESPSDSTLVVEVAVTTVVRALGTCVAFLAAAAAVSAGLRMAGHSIGWGFVNLFNPDVEASAPTWFSAWLLLACAGVLTVLASAASRTRDRHRVSWWLLTAAFVAMSLDEVAAYREGWIFRLRDLLDVGGVFYFAWVIPGSLVVAVMALVLLPFVRSLPRTTAIRFVVAGGAYVTGALGMEMVGGWYIERYPGESWTYAALVGIEELLEVVGSIAFLRALLLHFCRTTRTIRVAVRAA